MKLKQTFKKNPFFYRIYFCTKMMDKNLSLPNSTHDFFLDGFERSGNSYLVRLLNYTFGKSLKFSHHLHNIAPIKIAVRLNLDLLVPIREPENTIASFAIMRKYYGNTKVIDKLIDEILNDWIDYYSFVKNKCLKAKFIVIDDQFDVLLFLNKIASNYNVNCAKDFEQITRDFKIYYKNLNEKKSFERTNIPNKKRNLEKLKFIEIIKGNKNFDVAKKIFNQIKEETKSQL